MRYRHFLLIGIILLVDGCKNLNIKDDDILVLEHSYCDNKICKTDSLLLNRKLTNDTITFIYKNKNDTLGYSLKKALTNDSLINIFNLDCPLIDRKTIIISNTKFEILKYFYDKEYWVDEETSFFFNQNYGILVAFNDGWMSLTSSFEYDEISKTLIDSIIKDKTGFYLESTLPPLPFSEKKIIEIKE